MRPLPRAPSIPPPSQGDYQLSTRTADPIVLEQYGLRDLLPKPVSVEVLRRKIQEWLPEQRVREEAQADRESERRSSSGSVSSASIDDDSCTGSGYGILRVASPV